MTTEEATAATAEAAATTTSTPTAAAPVPAPAPAPDLLREIEQQLAQPGVDDEMRKKLIGAANLVKRYNLYKTTHVFEVGQLVKWKSGLSNRRMPIGDDIGIVSRVLDTPIFDQNRKDAGNPYFRGSSLTKLLLLIAVSIP
jgi:hypothetical protein